ncbi:MAG TPA: acetylglucosamine-6-sulfatase [Verrucomicrobiales bacterium]|nr:acetylglucosamine-6-sulfatase [Verrucomicrobiales bacterium]|tara:strand:+ start:24 stop:1445 length:1422 start_codon:yes stop_codon:yes gene_type:complete
MPCGWTSWAAPRNIVLILSDDHRHDFMGFMEGGPAFLETPNLDRMAAQGAHFRNAFVTTSLCSPSRASILTGQYMHHHRVVDNQRPVAEGTRFFPEYLQEAGYTTGFVGKWHMGHDHDEPRKGFNHWVSFKGQGTYFDPELNLNGSRKSFKGYTTDILADQALEWLKTRSDEDPFLLYLSFKAVHYPFQPAPRHHGRYEDKAIDYPMTMANTESNYQTQSNWIRERRYGIHGIDHMETGPLDKDPVPSFDDLYHRYCETVHGLDENIGRVLDYLDSSKLMENTIVVYLGDNGFALGEHGFYDKRDAFEESIRIPMLAMAPGLIKPGSKIDAMMLNMDLAPTLLEAANINIQKSMQLDGQSALPWLRGETIPWRDHILYEYHWEWNFPATPTTLAIRGDRYKYIYYHGVWDRNGFYDLETDPNERVNLIKIPAYQEQILSMRSQLFQELDASGGLVLPVRPPKGVQFYDRKLRR